MVANPTPVPIIFGPNIDGNFSIRKTELLGVLADTVVMANKSFTVTDHTTESSCVTGTGSTVGSQLVKLNASDSNAAYGASATVQPAALRALVLIRSY